MYVCYLLCYDLWCSVLNTYPISHSIVVLILWFSYNYCISEDIVKEYFFANTITELVSIAGHFYQHISEMINHNRK